MDPNEETQNPLSSDKTMTWVGDETLLEVNAGAERRVEAESLPDIASVIPSDRYRLDGEAGRGAMGVVYRGHDLKLDRAVAIKLLSQGSDGAVGNRHLMLDSLRFEARVMAGIDHPGVVRIHELIEGEGFVLIVMEYVEGVSLADWLRDFAGDRDQRIAEGMRLYKQLVDAVSAAHHRGIVHRDLKTANVMVTPDGSCKVLDFGIARSQADQGAGVQGPAGTPAYMAPEIFEPGLEITARVDVYALGVILYEIITGNRPYQNQSMALLLENARRGEKPAITADRFGVMADAAAVCEKAMNPDPGARYQDASDLAADVACLLSSRPVGARGYPMAEQVVRGAFEHARVLMAALTVAALLAFSLNYAADAMHITAEESLIKELEEKLAVLTHAALGRLEGAEGKPVGLLDLRRSIRALDPEVQEVNLLASDHPLSPEKHEQGWRRVRDGKIIIYRRTLDETDPEAGLALLAFGQVQAGPDQGSVLRLFISSRFVAHRFEEIETDYLLIETLAWALALGVILIALTGATLRWRLARPGTA